MLANHYTTEVNVGVIAIIFIDFNFLFFSKKYSYFRGYFYFHPGGK